jgi:hypothetical protein
VTHTEATIRYSLKMEKVPPPKPLSTTIRLHDANGVCNLLFVKCLASETVRQRLILEFLRLQQSLGDSQIELTTPLLRRYSV